MIRVSQSTGESSNWAGYVVATSLSSPQPGVTAVYGTWVVQTVTKSNPTTYSSQWIGIGGAFDSTLVQTGTESDATSTTTSYNAWYEILPNSETSLFTVSSGDVMTASVVCTSSPCSTSSSHHQSKQSWTITITDLTSAKSSVIKLSYASSLKSAEWIEERPTVGGD